MITQNALLRLCEKRGSFLGACRPNIRLRAIGKPIFAKLFSWTAVFFANYARACKTTVHKDSQFQIPFRISQSNGKKEIQKQISQRWNPFLDFAFYCKSEIRILKSKSRFPNRTHPKYWTTSHFPFQHLGNENNLCSISTGCKKHGRNKLHLTAIKRRRQFIKSAMIEFFWGGRTCQRVIK